MDCPKCHFIIETPEEHATQVESGESFNVEFGQTEYWWRGTVWCPVCGSGFEYGDSSL